MPEVLYLTARLQEVAESILRLDATGDHPFDKFGYVYPTDAGLAFEDPGLVLADLFAPTALG